MMNFGWHDGANRRTEAALSLENVLMDCNLNISLIRRDGLKGSIHLSDLQAKRIRVTTQQGDVIAFETIAALIDGCWAYDDEAPTFQYTEDK